MAQFTPGQIPTREELRDWILTESAKQFPDKPEWAVSAGWWEKHRPDGYCSKHTVCKYHGQPQNGKGWANLVMELTGRTVPRGAEVAGYMSAAQAGHIPTKNELHDFITSMLDRVGTSLSSYDRARPAGWATGMAVCRAYGYDRNAAAWKKLVLEVADIKYVNGRTISRDPKLDGPVDSIGRGLNRAALDATEHIGCRKIWRPVMAWDHMTACYRPTGMWESLMQIGPFPPQRKR